MNISNADYFTFNVDNTMFLTGQTGSGKTEFVRRLIKKYEDAFTPKEMQYVIFDLKMCEFVGEGGCKPEYLYFSIITDSGFGLERLEELAAIAEARTSLRENPLLFIYIEECDMAALDQARFDTALMTINNNAKQANMKLIYSTSRPSPNVISKQLLDSFDLIVAGQLASDADYKYLGVPKAKNQPPYSFTIVENNNK